jgi:hypothetical protein
MVREMVDGDLYDAQRHAFLRTHGHDVPMSVEG